MLLRQQGQEDSLQLQPRISRLFIKAMSWEADAEWDRKWARAVVACLYCPCCRRTSGLHRYSHVPDTTQIQQRATLLKVTGDWSSRYNAAFPWMHVDLRLEHTTHRNIDADQAHLVMATALSSGGREGWIFPLHPPKISGTAKGTWQRGKSSDSAYKIPDPPFVQASAGCAGARLTNTTQKIWCQHPGFRHCKPPHWIWCSGNKKEGAGYTIQGAWFGWFCVNRCMI